MNRNATIVEQDCCGQRNGDDQRTGVISGLRGIPFSRRLDYRLKSIGARAHRSTSPRETWRARASG